MASLGSLSFIIDTPSERFIIDTPSERRTAIFSRNSATGGVGCWRRRWRWDGRGCADSTACDSVVWSRKRHEDVAFLRLCSPSSRKMGRCAVEAAGKSVSAGSGSDDGGDDLGSKTLNDAIEKSKKVLAVQKELLQRITERKKVILSIKDGIKHNEADGVSSGRGNGSLTESEPSFSKGHMNDDKSKGKSYNIGTKSSTFQTVTTTHKISVSEEKGAVAKSRGGASVTGPLGLLREKESISTMSTLSPSALPKISEPVEAKMAKDDEFLEENPQVNFEEEESEKPPPLAGENVMNVVLAAAECAPWIKTGGLGDVAGSLPKALARRGHRVMVVVPRYDNYPGTQQVGAKRQYTAFGQDMEITYHLAFIDGVDFVFIDSPIFRHTGNNIYGGERLDVLKRMVLFCKAAVEVPWHVPCGGVCYGDGNLCFIANDWHTALLPVYLKAYYRDNGMMKYTRSVLVIHNIAHQGRGPVDDFQYVDLPERYIDYFKLYDPIGGEHFNIFAAGLKAADRIVTVSHGYAWELKSSEGGWGLHEIINENNWKFEGIVNGIDAKEWNPQVDVHLKSDGYANYSLETLKTGKAQCKAALQKELGLPVRDEVPVVGFIGRLDDQKGVDLIAEAIPWLVGQDMQLVMLGTGRADLENMLRNFEGQYRDKVRGWVGFSVKMAHRITAGADILLMPSRFEPCGLNQLYAMMYGTVPVVHAVGGLRDTVPQFKPFEETGLGWTFDRAEANKMIRALGHCFNTYWNYKSSWEGLQRRGMMQDLSWDTAAQRYEEALVKAKYQW